MHIITYKVLQHIKQHYTYKYQYSQKSTIVINRIAHRNIPTQTTQGTAQQANLTPMFNR
uniref:Uncharacterized protein n=1 Tax=Arion vulgaris TaxID=1028688 RepID=A0A0B7A6P6_9EUPU